MEQWDASCQNYVKKLNARLEWAYKVACENIQKEPEHHKKSNEVAFLWNRTLVELLTSFHPLLWTSSGLRENWKTAPYMGSNRFYEHAQNLLGGVKR